MLLMEKAHRPKRGRLRAGPLLRVRVLLNRLRLDRALASGADALGSPELQLRSEQLQRPRTRERLANGMNRLLAIAFGDPRRHVGPARVPFRHQRVRPNAERFEALAEALKSSGPHAVKGLAMASNLLEDGRGELYANDTPGDLGRALDATITALQADGPPNAPMSRSSVGESMELAGAGSVR